MDALHTPVGERGLAASWAMDAGSMIQGGMLGIATQVSDEIYRYRAALDNQDEIGALKRQLSSLQQLKTEVKQLRAENNQLRRWAHFPAAVDGFRPLGANVIGRSISSMGRTIRINQGKNAGIKRGDGVINVDHQVVGRVLWVSGNAADVILVTDPASTLDVLVQRSRAHGLSRGKGGEPNHVVVKDFDRLMDVQKGDILITAGTNKDFPKGLPLAQVHQVFPPHEGVYLKVEAQTLANTENLEQVWVLRYQKQLAYPRLGKELPEVNEWLAPSQPQASLDADQKTSSQTAVSKESVMTSRNQEPSIATQPKEKASPTSVMEIISMKKMMEVSAPSGVKIRSGPGIEHWVVETKDKGEQLYATGEVKGKDWIRISLPTGIQGYVFAPLLNEVAQASLPSSKGQP